MDFLLWELINIGKVVFYTDNILIFTKAIKEHCNVVN